MKWTYDWLKDYLDTGATAPQIADELTRIGLEVEELFIPTEPVVAKIVECEDIPDTHLHKLMVDDGSGILRQVVCGAPNARVGLVSALAKPGCKIGDMEIKSGKIRGVLSDGMMCSSKELGISDDHSGIIELDETKETLGKVPSSLINHPSSIVFDAGITPNRPDYLAVRGIARDLAAAGFGTLRMPQSSEFKVQSSDGKRKVIIENEKGCPTYRMLEIHGLTMAKSNSVIAARLQAIGINPKNAAIDATNYICFDMAQPMHCFDADEINGDIIVRNARDGEKFTDLFGNEHELFGTDLVISDGDGILALAGVVGGMRGMTSDKTSNIILESAYFDPVTVRRTAKRVGIQSDASYRYERGIDPTITGQALAAAAKIIMDECGGNVVGGFTAGGVQSSKFKVQIEYNPDLFKQKTGVDLPAERQKEILEKLGFEVAETPHSTQSTPHWVVTPPSARVDVVIPENIVSELIRMYGYEKIKSKEQTANSKEYLNINAVKKKLVARGFFECMNYGFGDSKKEKILSNKESVMILNPIIEPFDTVRNSLVQSMLDVVANNDRFRRSNLVLFELAPVFDGTNPGNQHEQLIIARTGVAGDKIGIKHGAASSIYDIREDLLSLFPGGTVLTDDEPPMWANPYRAGLVQTDGKTVATFAELHPGIAKHFGIKTNVVIGLVDNAESLMSQTDWRAAQKNSAPKIDMSEFPLITRDFAFITESDFLPPVIADAAMAADGRIIELNVFDVFNLPDGKTSVAFEIVIQPESNMSDADLMLIQNAVIESVEKNCPAKIRDK